MANITKAIKLSDFSGKIKVIIVFKVGAKDA